ncbi:VOC family protein [Psychrobacillus glaciei]|uniref:VOC family protein n=1 Tax=Psychrobacillus glaciei TaxID=2283160 RepID=A0A5J6SSU4_9BACI|nr:VOC family protein [Psychrobacillus glaciei]QFG00640.1 VOC family protein [Psychrobacillus glaciei]
MSKITPFLMFEGQAEAAINFYTSVFRDFKIIRLAHYGADGPGKEGEVSQAAFNINGQEFLCTDSFVQHAFTFTPSLSLFVECDSEEEIDEAYDKLLEGGQSLMPIDKYPFSKKFGWIQDKFGVSWQLNLAN